MIPQPAYEFKLVLVGDSSVGKSSILARFVDDNFNENLLSTIGVDFKFRKIKVEGKEVKLQIWDTAGQEMFRSITSAYYNSSDAIVVVYDISSYHSIESVKDYWLQQAQNNNKNNASMFLVGNKLDEAATKREVQSFSVQSVMDGHHIVKHFQVSAKTGENIENCFIQICKALISKNKEVKLTQPQPAQQNNSTFAPLQPKLTQTNTSSPYQRNKCCPN